MYCQSGIQNVEASFPGNSKLQMNIIQETCRAVQDISMDSAGPLFSSTIQSIVEEELGTKDPYRKVKHDSIRKIHRFIPYLEIILKSANDKLDIAANPGFSIKQEVNRITANKKDGNALQSLREDLNRSVTVLYIGDDYEGVLFDKILLGQLKSKRLVFGVRSYPILNEVTLQDAQNLGIDKVCEVMESGSRIARTDLTQRIKEFLYMFHDADVVIAKGQGNFETLMDVDRPIYLLFKVKCESIARRCGHPTGTSILYLNEKCEKN